MPGVGWRAELKKCKRRDARSQREREAVKVNSRARTAQRQETKIKSDTEPTRARRDRSHRWLKILSQR
jgi:hypothetical protein